VGAPILYSLIVSNAGPNPASNVVARMPMVDTFYLGPVVANRGSHSVNAGFLDFRLGTLALGDSALVSITVTGAVVGVLSNFVSVFSDAVDPRVTNNSVVLSKTLVWPELTISDVRITEGNLGYTNALFTVSHNSLLPPALNVSFTTSNGTATAPTDFLPVSGTLSFPTGTNRLTISVPVHGDTDIELDEVFQVTLFNPVLATLGKAVGVGTIVNDDGHAGEVYSFEWSPVAPQQRSDTPLAAVITARDAQGNLATEFNRPVALRTLVDEASLPNGDFDTGSLAPWTPLNAGVDPGPYEVIPFDTSGSGQLSHAFRLTPNNGAPDGLQQSVALRGGVTYRFDLDAAQALEDASNVYNGGDTEVRLVVGGTEVCSFNFSAFGDIGGGRVFRTNLHGLFPAPSDGLYEVKLLIYRAWGAYANLWGVVDDVRMAPVLASPVPEIVSFTNGVWTGSLRFALPLDKVFVRADDSNGHIGDSRSFSVVNVPVLHLLSPANGPLRLEFTAETGRVYEMQFSRDLIQWQSAGPTVIGAGVVVQWVDPGPPWTDSPPEDAPSRFYRVILRP
jgi:hypothetical protein